VSKGFEISGSWLAHNPFSLRIKFDIVDFGEKDVNLMGLLFDLFQWSSCNNGHDASVPVVELQQWPRRIWTESNHWPEKGQQ
jgi:hypothetical protein